MQGEKEKKEENKPVCKLQITDYCMNHDRNKLKIIDRIGKRPGSNLDKLNKLNRRRDKQ